MAQASNRIEVQAHLIEACYDDERQRAIVIYRLEARAGETNHICLFNAEHPIGRLDVGTVLDAMCALYGRAPGHGWN